MPSESLLALHKLHRSYNSFAEFESELPSLLQQGEKIPECIEVTKLLGILEPLSGAYISPEELLIKGPNWRESLVGNGLLSRNRAVLWLLEHLYGSLEVLRNQDIYIAEALSGFARWLQRHLEGKKLICSEYLDGEDTSLFNALHQDLCALSFANDSFDLVLCNELFEHVRNLDHAFAEIARVLRPTGRLVATCPMAFGQVDSITKVLPDPVTGQNQFLDEIELHGDPIRPDRGSLVYRIPGWEILNQLRNANFSGARVHHFASWKHGVMGSDLPGVLIFEAWT